MDRLHTSRLQKHLRLTALIMALICLGISGGMTLMHTEDLGSLRQFHASTSAFSQGASSDTPDACLACQWENALFNPQVPVVPVLHPPLTPLPLLSVSSQTRFPYPFDHTSPRAPPHVS